MFHHSFNLRKNKSGWDLDCFGRLHHVSQTTGFRMFSPPTFNYDEKANAAGSIATTAKIVVTTNDNLILVTFC